MRSGFFNNTTVWAEDFAKFAGGILTNGILADTDDVLLVSAAGDGMKVNVAPGYAWIDGHFGLNEDTTPLQLTIADGVYPRIDRIVVRLDRDAKNISLQAIAGEPEASPTAPDIVRDGTIYDLGLATIAIPAGTLEITAEMITDTRRNAAVCGGIYPKMSDAFVYPGANHIGDIKMTACAAAPDGWLICDGSAVSRVRYADLFANIGTAYGSGDGSTTFNIPDLRGRTAFGKNSGTFNVLGKTGGTETHTLTVQELAAHTHTITTTVTAKSDSHENPSVKNIFQMGQTAEETVELPAESSASTTGQNAPFSILPPYNTVNYIIYTGVIST